MPLLKVNDWSCDVYKLVAVIDTLDPYKSNAFKLFPKIPSRHWLLWQLEQHSLLKTFNNGNKPCEPFDYFLHVSLLFFRKKVLTKQRRLVFYNEIHVGSMKAWKGVKNWALLSKKWPLDVLFSKWKQCWRDNQWLQGIKWSVVPLPWLACICDELFLCNLGQKQQ